MPSPAHQSPTNHPGFWPTIVRTVLVEVFVLLALAVAIVGYLNWSSDAAWAEFKAANKPPAPNASIHAVKGHMPCHRSA
jgi:hypothetical protein